MSAPQRDAARVALKRTRRSGQGPNEGQVIDLSEATPLSLSTVASRPQKKTIELPEVHLVQDALVAEGGYAAIKKKLSDFYDLVYTATAKFGNSAASVRLIVDTGSSDLWVNSKVYDSTTSEEVPNGDAVLNYGEGHVEGKKVKDKFCFSGACVHKQSFILADRITEMPLANTGAAFDGLLGLAYPGLSEVGNGADTYLATLVAENIWSPLAFGLCILDATDDGESFLSFGTLDEVLAEVPSGWGPGVNLPILVPEYQVGGAIQYTPQYWMVQTSGAAVNDFYQTTFEAFAMLDSGTSLITIPFTAYLDILPSLLPADGSCFQMAGQVICPCDASLGTLSFTFASPTDKSQTLKIDLGTEDLLAFAGKAKYSDGSVKDICRLGVQQSTMPFMILGDVFMRKVYTVHDVTGMQMTLFPRGAGEAFVGAAATAAAETRGEAPPAAPTSEEFTSDVRDTVSMVALFGGAMLFWAAIHFREDAGRLSEQDNRVENRYRAMT